MRDSRPTTHDRLIQEVKALRTEVNFLKKQLNSNKYSDTHFEYTSYLEHSSEQIAQYKKIPERY